MPNWKPTAEALAVSVVKTITSLIEPIEAHTPNLLPDLRQSKKLAVVSDYSGEHDSSPFQVLSFLIADSESVLGEWNKERLAIREKYLSDGRRLGFKSLGDETKQKAIFSFLKAASTINGVVFCVAIDKSTQPFSSMYQLAITDEAKATWKPKVWEKLIRISAFGSILVGGLCNAEQDVHWIMDQDDIIANDLLLEGAASVIGRMFSIHTPCQPGKVSLGVANEFDDKRLAEDLVSIVDLAGGATAENHAALGIDRIPRSSDLLIPVRERTSTKTQFLSAWMSDETVPLKKIVLLVRPHSTGEMLFSIGRPHMFTDIPPDTSALWLPFDTRMRGLSLPT